MDNKQIAIELVYSYLNNPSQYSKNYISTNFQVVIELISRDLEEYLECNSTIKSESLGAESVTYRNRDFSDIIDKIKIFLPTPRPKYGILYC